MKELPLDKDGDVCYTGMHYRQSNKTGGYDGANESDIQDDERLGSLD